MKQRARIKRLLSRALERRLAAEAARLEHALRGAVDHQGLVRVRVRVRVSSGPSVPG